MEDNEILKCETYTSLVEGITSILLGVHPCFNSNDEAMDHIVYYTKEFIVEKLRIEKRILISLDKLNEILLSMKDNNVVEIDDEGNVKLKGCESYVNESYKQDGIRTIKNN